MRTLWRKKSELATDRTNRSCFSVFGTCIAGLRVDVSTTIDGADRVSHTVTAILTSIASPAQDVTRAQYPEPCSGLCGTCIDDSRSALGTDIDGAAHASTSPTSIASSVPEKRGSPKTQRVRSLLLHPRGVVLYVKPVVSNYNSANHHAQSRPLKGT